LVSATEFTKSIKAKLTSALFLLALYYRATGLRSEAALEGTPTNFIKGLSYHNISGVSIAPKVFLQYIPAVSIRVVFPIATRVFSSFGLFVIFSFSLRQRIPQALLLFSPMATLFVVLANT
jgi:hypothetical protein